MDTFPSSPPAAVRADLAALLASLDGDGIPPKLALRSEQFAGLPAMDAEFADEFSTTRLTEERRETPS